RAEPSSVRAEASSVRAAASSVRAEPHSVRAEASPVRAEPVEALASPSTSSGRTGVGSPLLQAQDLTVRFGGLVAVDNVSATFMPGELVGISGPNGAGKTTFFNAISGVSRPTSGRLELRGRSLAGQAPHRFAAHGLARTFQTPRTFGDMPVRDNIAFGLKFAGRRRREYIFWGDEVGVPWVLRTPESILDLIGLRAQAELPAAAITPSQQRLLEIGMA